MKVSAKNMIVSAQRQKTLKNLEAIIVVSLNLRELQQGEAIAQDVVVELTDKMTSFTVISRLRTTFMIFTRTLHKASQKLVKAQDSDSTRKVVAERSKTFTRHLKVRKMPETSDNQKSEIKTATMDILTSLKITPLTMMRMILLKVSISTKSECGVEASVRKITMRSGAKSHTQRKELKIMLVNSMQTG